ncbi:MAG: aminopeptidase P family protein [Firmicutes bacterium]|nr:aminopeptidase P family protein [Bacillota bacterium]
MEKNYINERIAALREIMRKKSIDAYIFTGSDAHQSEYVTGYWQSREWISGFTGSNGIVVVTADEAGLWTDGRYFLQAEKQLDGTVIKLFKPGENGGQDVPNYSKWISQKFAEKSEVNIGFDARTLSIAAFNDLKNAIKATYFFEDIVNELWENRPILPISPAFIHDIKFTGKTSTEKLAELRAKIQEKKPNALYFTAALDEIAWITNIRGNDIENTPVVFAYLLVDSQNAWLFIDERKLTSEVKSHLSDFTICAYDEIFDYVKEKSADKTLLYSPNSSSVSLLNAVPKTAEFKKTFSIISDLKAVKNPTEIANMRNAFLKEGVALVRLLKWISELGEIAVDEVDVQEKIAALRLEQADCVGDSFTTIAAYGENAAIVHYSPTKESCATVKKEGFLLVDTGGQYLDGTTDVTRTIAVGKLTDEMRRDFTLVLKGHIALAQATFLKGISGVNLDILARQAIWDAHMNYNHGTGHGIGYFLNVHETPPGIAHRPGNPAKALLPGMLCSNEPGLYKAGKHGIRTENDMLVTEVTTNEFGTFLAFEIISFCPIDITAVDKTLLSPTELAFLNNYHEQVYQKLSPLLTADEQVWLRNATKVI